MIIKLLKSGEDYLEAIYNLSKDKLSIKSIEIVNFLKVSRPSVSRALSILAEQNYIIKENYGKIYLTDKGKEKALQITKKHTALKTLFTEILKVSAETAEIDACKIEHNLSEETTEKLLEFLK